MLEDSDGLGSKKINFIPKKTIPYRATALAKTNNLCIFTLQDKTQDTHITRLITVSVITIVQLTDTLCVLYAVLPEPIQSMLQMKPVVQLEQTLASDTWQSVYRTPTRNDHNEGVFIRGS